MYGVACGLSQRLHDNVARPTGTSVLPMTSVSPFDTSQSTLPAPHSEFFPTLHSSTPHSFSPPVYTCITRLCARRRGRVHTPGHFDSFDPSTPAGDSNAPHCGNHQSAQNDRRPPGGDREGSRREKRRRRSPPRPAANTTRCKMSTTPSRPRRRSSKRTPAAVRPATTGRPKISLTRSCHAAAIPMPVAAKVATTAIPTGRQAQTEQPLLQQIDQRVLDQFRIAMVGETAREFLYEAKTLFNFPQQNPAAVRRDPSTVKPGHDFPTATLLKSERSLGTLCLHETASSVKCKCLSATSFTSGRAVSCHRIGEKSGLTARRISEDQRSQRRLYALA